MVTNPAPRRRSPPPFSRIFRHPVVPILVILLINLIIAANLVGDYTESWDEAPSYRYGARSLKAYSHPVERLKKEDEKGPFFVMAALLAAERIELVFPDTPRLDRLHFINFLSFEISLFFLYIVCLRFMSTLAAVSAVLLFNTQPLLWGHAFINPKDMPFMAFFAGSIALGIWMSSAFKGVRFHPARSGQEGIRFNPGEFKRIISSGLAHALAQIAVLGLLLFLSRRLVGDWIALLIESAYAAPPGSRLAQLFSLLAENSSSIPAEAYIRKGIGLYGQLLSLLGWGALFLALALAYRLLAGAVEIDTGSRHVTLPGLLARVLLAAAFVGFSSSIRVLGPAAGVLVGIYFILKNGRKSWLVLPLYTAAAALVTYLTWPGLWGDAVRRYIGFITEASDFPFEGEALFFGVAYAAADLPRQYLPVMLSLQFTEVALLLFALGLVYGVYRARQGSLDRVLLALIAAWFFVPFSLVVLVRPPMYDNFRHFLFVVPPVFVFAGLGTAAVFDRLKSPAWKFVLLAAILLPGIYWIVQLHPYQYVYYNVLVGGPGGAFRRFETDYWALSYREATEYLNEVAPSGAGVVVWGPDQVVKRYAREDLEILEFKEGGQQPAPDYAILSTRWDNDQLLYPYSRILYSVGRVGAVFVVVKQVSSDPAVIP